ncbi:hypothetical protein N7495_006334 [Penicillium taxi]|uniref:uncharacterized protein n=1 Tax=Penicillium taxi TaxID=168475 RepID=UPI0025457F3B|nr:uncharacterized protein N7495_006334 [Penicillium taxi]KAJ5894643.1 hypothetical protein N7495_006334 [Penicillium taxi]
MAPPEYESKKQRKRSDYGYHQTHQTRWFDNDMYAHLNNTVYTALFDTIANSYLIEQCGMNPFSVNNPTPKDSTEKPSASATKQIGLLVSAHADFFASVAFPDILDVGLRVAKLGSSSVTWEVGVFLKGEDDVKMVGVYTHVFVLRETMRVGAGGMEDRVRRGLEKLLSGPNAQL